MRNPDILPVDERALFKKAESPYAETKQLCEKLLTNEDVNSKEFIVSNYKIIKNLSENLNKRMLVLCTSYKQISDFKNLSDKNMLFQDINSSKQILLDKYLKSKNSVLFGTSSFWEGVDLPEDKLEVLFILKLPFSNPYNPIVQAKIESYIENNLDPYDRKKILKKIQIDQTFPDFIFQNQKKLKKFILS